MINTHDGRAPGYHPLRKIRVGLAGIKRAVILDFSVAYKLVASLAGLLVAATWETLFHFLFLLAVTGLMLMSEVFNTVVESFCDYLEQDTDARIRDIKDMAAGASLIAILIWYVVLGVVVYEVFARTDLFARSQSLL